VFNRVAIVRGIVVVAFFIVVGLAVTSIMTSCTTTTGGAGSAVLDETAAAQKAKEDSLAREKYKREFLIAFSTGNEHHKNKNYIDAIKPLLKAARMDTGKQYPTIFTKLADSYLKLDKPDSALIVYQNALKRYPDNAFFWRSSGWLLTAKQQIPEAIEAYSNAIDLDGKTLADYKNLGPLLISEDRLDEALAIYEKIAQMDPKDVEAQQIYAKLMDQLGGDVMDVIAAKEKALEADPKNVMLMFELGKKYFNEQMFAEAVQKFDLLLAISPNDVSALEFKGNALQNDEKFADAIKTYDKILKLKPNHVKVMCDVATSYRELGKLRQAMSFAQKAIRTDPDFGLGYIVKGEVYEAAADACINKRAKRITNFDDKLVYEKAYKQYQIAASRDVSISDMAKRKMGYIKPEIPTGEDRFMHPDQKEPALDCYTWLPK